MPAGIKANSDGSAAIQVGGTDVITLTSGGAATFVTSPTTVQAGTAAAPSITFSGDTNTGIYSPGADTVGLTAGGTLVGSVGLGTTLALQGATSQSGTGITFPATQSASSNANTLDDYEEGTWTPVYDTGFSAVTYSARTGTYTKIGRFVQLNLFISAVSATASGNITITGLPFSTGAYTQNNYIGVVQVQTTSGTLAAGTVLMRITDSSSTLFFQTQSTAGVASMAGSQLGASSVINATIQYFTST